MGIRAAALLAIGSCGVGFFAAWLIFRSDGTCRIDDASPSQDAKGLQRVTQEKPASPKSSDLDRADSRVPALTERPAAPDATQVTPASQPPKLTTRAPTDPRDFPETTLDEMTKKREAIQKLLGEKSNPILFKRFDDNLADHVSDEKTYSGTDEDQKVIYAVKMTQDGTWRTELPRAGYEDLYALKDETRRLDKLINEKTVAEYLDKKAKDEAGQPR